MSGRGFCAGMKRSGRCALLLCLATAALGNETIPVWPAGVAPPEPGGPTELVVVERAASGAPLRDRYATQIVEPDLTVFPAADAGRCALLILPGGGYQRVVMDKEGYESAQWFAARGVSSFVMRYRLPGEYAEPRPDLPLADAQRALRVVRSHAAEHRFDAGCVGVLGFSAGGHLAGLLATARPDDLYAAVDEIDTLPARPDFAVLMYPVVTMLAPHAHAGSREKLLGISPDADLASRWSVDERVTARTPPVFLLHAADDETVPVDNALLLYRALRAARVPVELHLFATGGHGFGLRSPPGVPVAAWPELVLRWLPQAVAPGAKGSSATSR